MLWRYSSQIVVCQWFTLGILSFAVLSGCKDKTETSLAFAVMGDVPYGLDPEEMAAEDAILRDQIATLNRDERLAFVMHVGDIKKGAPPCDRAVFEKVEAILRTSAHPLFIIPGDNEWNDCQNPGEAWDFWESHFMRFDEHWPNELGVERQSEREENFAFTEGGILIVGVNLVGGKVHDEQEWKTRIDQNRRWLRSQFSDHASDASAAVVFIHANPGKQTNGKFEYKNNAFQPIIEYLDSGSEVDFPRPILLIHGDGHVWIRDNPFPNAGRRITRIQVTRGGVEGPLIVEVGSDGNQPFRFTRDR